MSEMRNELRSITDPKQSLGDIVKQINLAWCFDAWYEKIILVVLSTLGIWKILGWIF